MSRVRRREGRRHSGEWLLAARDTAEHTYPVSWSRGENMYIRRVLIFKSLPNLSASLSMNESLFVLRKDSANAAAGCIGCEYPTAVNDCQGQTAGSILIAVAQFHYVLCPSCPPACRAAPWRSAPRRTLPCRAVGVFGPHGVPRGDKNRICFCVHVARFISSPLCSPPFGASRLLLRPHLPRLRFLFLYSLFAYFSYLYVYNGCRRA